MTVVDPLKTFDTAMTNLAKAIAETENRLLHVKAYADKTQTMTMTVTENLKVVRHNQAILGEAYAAFKDAKGLSESEAAGHLKAIAAVLQLAADAGVDLTKEAKKVEVEAKAWAAWHFHLATFAPEECFYCGSEFESRTRGWWDDQNHPYCKIEHLIEKRGLTYYPSYPADAIRALGPDWFPQRGAVLARVGNSSTRHPPVYASLIKVRATLLGNPSTESWLEFAQNTGCYRPLWRGAYEPTELFICEHCQGKFNLWDCGWKTEESKYFCCNSCANRYENHTLDPDTRLVCPKFSSIGITEDVNYIRVGLLADTGFTSWIDLARDAGWEYPTKEWE